MNVNTMPVAQNAGQSQVPNIENYYATGDYGAAVWRGAINGFYPMMRAGNKLSSGNRGIDFLGSRGLSAPAPPTIVRWDHPCQDYIDNFYGLFAGMRSDARQYDIRGPNGLWQNGSWAASGNPDDKTALPNMSIAQTPATERLDPRRPSWVTNPVRTYLEDFTATIPPVAFPNAPPAPISARETPAPIRTTLPEAFRSSDVAASGTDGWETMLAVDSTLLRRRDTTWRPWNAVLAPATGNIDFNPQTAIHADPAFDPLFALNFPRPVPYVNMNPPAGPGSFFPGVTGYTMAMADNDPYASGPLPGINGATNQYCLKTTDYRNTDRNPFFRYQLFTKLGSVTTTRSNVYAIWVTCGFFECERMDPNAAIQSQEGTGLNDFSNAQRFPDGFRIVRELGSESGDIRRHRIFGIFDRSIPVGFERGENHNVDRAFLFRQILN